jgi:hypothetical protein
LGGHGSHRTEPHRLALERPGLAASGLGLNQADSADASDLVLCCEFHSWDALRGYESHPLHQELRAIIGPLRAERRVVDFEFEPAAAGDSL